MKKLISVITPCFNEEENVKNCYLAVKEVFQKKLPNYRYEHVFCDNASVDKTVEVLKEIAKKDKKIKIIVNARNFGVNRSTFNGVLNTKGDAVLVLLPADLQDPPGLIFNFVKKWEKGFKVVYGVRKNRREIFLTSLSRKLYYRLINRLTDIYLPPDVGNFQLIDRVVVEALRNFDDYYPYNRGMIASCGFKATGINYNVRARKIGFSKTSLYQLLDQGLNGLISFTNVPLRVCMLLGFILAGLSILYAFIQLAISVFWYRKFGPPGIASMIVALFFFSGVQLFFLGFLGEYIGAIHSQVRKRPLVIEKERVNFKNS